MLYAHHSTRRRRARYFFLPSHATSELAILLEPHEP